MGFTGTGWTGRGATKCHTKSLGRGNVTSIRKWGNDKTISTTQKFILIIEIDIGNGDFEGLHYVMIGVT